MIDSSWPRHSLTLHQRGSLWRRFRNHLAQPLWPSGRYIDYATAIALDNENRPKFFALQTVFWIQLTDFMEIVPQHPHLRDVKLPTRPMVMHQFPFGKSDGDGGGDGDGPRTEDPQAPVTVASETKGGSPPDTTMVNGI